MIRFRDFVPRMLSAPAFFKVGEYESFEAAVAAANQWIEEQRIDLVNIETVVLPNIWSRYEEGSTDGSLHQRRLAQLLASDRPRVVPGMRDEERKMRDEG